MCTCEGECGLTSGGAPKTDEVGDAALRHHKHGRRRPGASSLPSPISSSFVLQT